MKPYDGRLIILTMLLSMLAGYIDALGFISLGGTFVSFMSGNSTQLAVGLAHGAYVKALIPAGIIVLFVFGVAAGAAIGHAVDHIRAPAVLAFVTLLLALAAGLHLGGHDFAAAIFMTMAMGAENNVFERDGEVTIGLTYMTGTLVKVGQRLAGAFWGGPRFAWAPYLLLWLGLVLGGIVGAISYGRLGLDSLWIAAIWAVCLAFSARNVQSHEARYV